MKRYSITDYHKPEMSEDNNGEWCRWLDFIEFKVYVTGVLRGMGAEEEYIEFIFGEFEKLIDCLEERK